MSISALERKRLVWRCRRGLLENDIILQRFFSKFTSELTEGEWLAFKEMLDLGDNELLDLLLGKEELNKKFDNSVSWSLLQKIRSA
ncbi:MAG: succinate dehydrogenase assembly factor 2 [Proteobacteria bacterium]|nr:succinate dehydrogenase assembly factor 2 [Pseudomonadota bacterium]